MDTWIWPSLSGFTHLELILNRIKKQNKKKKKMPPSTILYQNQKGLTFIYKWKMYLSVRAKFESIILLDIQIHITEQQWFSSCNTFILIFFKWMKVLVRNRLILTSNSEKFQKREGRLPIALKALMLRFRPVWLKGFWKLLQAIDELQNK